MNNQPSLIEIYHWYDDWCYHHNCHIVDLDSGHILVSKFDAKGTWAMPFQVIRDYELYGTGRWYITFAGGENYRSATIEFNQSDVTQETLNKLLNDAFKYIESLDANDEV